MKKLKPILITTLLVLGLIVFVILITPVRITHYYPSSQLEANNSPLLIQTNKPVNPTSLAFIFSPSVSGKVVQTGFNQYQFLSDQPYPYDTTYQLTIDYNHASILTTTFSTPHNTSAQEPIDANQSDLLKKYPLIYHLPYDSPDVHITYDSPLTLKVTLKNPQFDYQSFLKQFFAKYGVDESTHQIVLGQPNS